jgi:hypothetical protein
MVKGARHMTRAGRSGWLGCSKGGLPLAEVRAVEGGGERHDISDFRGSLTSARAEKESLQGQDFAFCPHTTLPLPLPHATALLLLDQDTLTH